MGPGGVPIGHVLVTVVTRMLCLQLPLYRGPAENEA